MHSDRTIQDQPQRGDLDVQIVHSGSMATPLRQEILALCKLAYEEDLEALFNTFVDASHVLGYCNGRLVSHALWVTRYLQPAALPILRTAYVEAVATDPSYGRRGFAAAIMKRLVDEIHDYDLAALSPFSVDYYARLGWEQWRGPLSIRTNEGLLSSPADEEVMIFRLPQTPALDLSAPLSAEWREGELW
jgi:aminoglycoside 2'-N-acetyltransferase I